MVRGSPARHRARRDNIAKHPNDFCLLARSLTQIAIPGVPKEATIVLSIFAGFAYFASIPHLPLIAARDVCAPVPQGEERA